MNDNWKLNYGAVLVAECLAVIGFALSMPVIPLFLADELAITDPQKLKLWNGVIQSTAAIMLAIFAPIWGHIADIYSRRAMLLRAMFAGAIVMSAMGFVQAPWQLLVLRALQGALTGTIAAATVLTAGIVPVKQLALCLGLLQTGVAVGNSLGPVAGGVLTDILGHRAAFFGTGVLLVIAGFLTLFLVHDVNIHPKAEGVTLAHRGRKKLFPDIAPVIGNPVILSLVTIIFAIQVANTTANPILPLFLRELSAGSKFIGSETGLVLGAGAAATAIASIFAGRFSPLIGYWRTLVICLAAGCLSMIPQAFVQNTFQLTLIHATASFFIGGAIPVIQAMIAFNCAPEHQGEIFGFNTSLSSAGAALGPLIGSTVAMISYRAVFPITSLILGISSIGIMVSHRHKTQS